MYRLILFFVFVALSFTVSAQSRDNYKIYLIQDSLRVEIRKGFKNEVVLNSAPFSFEVHLYKTKTLGLFAAVPDTFYKTPATEEFPTCEMLGGIGIAEGYFNQDKFIYIDDKYDDGCNFWYYDSATDHRFDKVLHASKDSVVAIRTVESLLYSADRKTVKTKKQKKDLYLVFFDNDTEKCATEGSELNGIPNRRYLKLSFRKS